MATLQANDFIRVSYETYMGNQLGLNIRWYKVLVVQNGTGLDTEVAEGLMDTVGPQLADLISNPAQVIRVGVQKRSGVPLPSPVYSFGPALQGTAGNPPLPSNSCGVFTVTTGLTGRSRRGRTYVPFPSVADNEAPSGIPIPTAGYMTRLGIYAAYHIGQFVLPATATGGDITLGAYIVSGTGFVGPALTGATARQKWGSQHRRGSYGQANLRP